jgi:UV DNA damage endonuclease
VSAAAVAGEARPYACTMRLRHLGYVGQNLTLGLTTGRTLRLAGIGSDRLEEVIAANLTSLETILGWNLRHGIRFFRVASSVIPFASHESFDLEWPERFATELARIRAFAARHEMRLSMHPGQYTVLNSPRDEVVARAVDELVYHATFLDLVAPAEGSITLHLGGAYGERERAKATAVENARRLPDAVLRRLCLEHDDRIFDLDDALEVARAVGIPVIFDLHHHRCLHRRPDWRDDLGALLESVVATWGGRVPKFHLSSARAPGETAHADHVRDDDFALALEVFGGVGGDRPYDLMLEAKEKDRAVLRHLGRGAPAEPAGEARRSR